jgi:hypothetical protein
MKALEDLKHVQEAMLPGVITGDGFLGSDTRPIQDIIADDEQQMSYLGVDFGKLGARMRFLLEAGAVSQGTPTVVGGRWRVVADEAKGEFPSPWNDGLFHKEQVVVTPLDRPDTSVTFNELSLYLIEKHHFFQGKGSPHRLEPAVLKTVLRL